MYRDSELPERSTDGNNATTSEAIRPFRDGTAPTANIREERLIVASEDGVIDIDGLGAEELRWLERFLRVAIV